ncbi:E7 [Gammapapillomavirus 15]|nr:E7 [Gammapapillomavirus 15]
MKGSAATIPDIALEELVLPSNLLATEESLSPDDEPEEEPANPYRVDTLCGNCHRIVRLHFVATASSIRTVHQLLLQELAIVCVACSRTCFQDGRP